MKVTMHESLEMDTANQRLDMREYIVISGKPRRVG